MAKTRVEDVRDIALVGHEQVGKTTLADTLLFKARAVDRRGSVEDGTSVSDYDEEERERKYSIDTSVLHLEHKGKKIYLLDTPGKPDFVGSALEALNAVDNAVIVVSAPAGIQVNTRRMFAEAGQRGLARILVLNKMDADNVHFPELVSAIQDSLGKACVLCNVPVGVGAQFKGVIDLLNPSAPADGAAVDVNAARSKLTEAIVEADEELMMQYLEGAVSPDELLAAFPRALAAGTVVPIFCTSARKDIGVT